MTSWEKLWSPDQAIALCREIEAVCPAFGCHVALTGGLLYKDGCRKDADLLFYRVRQVAKIDIVGLFDALAPLGLERVTEDERWCIKATFRGRAVDCFFPELPGGEYADAKPDRTDLLLDIAAACEVAP